MKHTLLIRFVVACSLSSFSYYSYSFIESNKSFFSFKEVAFASSSLTSVAVKTNTQIHRENAFLSCFALPIETLQNSTSKIVGEAPGVQFGLLVKLKEDVLSF